VSCCGWPSVSVTWVSVIAGVLFVVCIPDVAGVTLKFLLSMLLFQCSCCCWHHDAIKSTGTLIVITCQAVITINVPVVFMARYIMVLRGATSLRGFLAGVGPEN
jgi:hypothetical protein